MALHLTWVFAFGLLGNIISCLVCLAPLPTFYRICKKKTSEGYQSIPYVTALFSAMLWLFYAIFKEGTTLLITINTFTFFTEISYITFYLFYATKKDMVLTLKLVILFNVLGFGVICAVALFLARGEKRVEFLGWVCMIFSLCVFVAPLCIVRKVIKTKSVEYMPFSLSVFLTLSAVMWFFYGHLKKDLFVAVPNILGFTFGILQMLLFVIYRNPGKVMEEPKNIQQANQLPEQHIVDVDKPSAAVCSCELINTVADPQMNENNLIGIEVEDGVGEIEVQARHKKQDMETTKVSA